jgi:hypothetical protein
VDNYEKMGTTVLKYYYHVGLWIAMRENGVLLWPRSAWPTLWRGCSRTNWVALSWLYRPLE